MTSFDRRTQPSLWLPVILILAVLIVHGLKLTSPGMNMLPNFSPWMALAFTGTLVLPRFLPWFVWPLAMLGMNAAILGVAAACQIESLTIYAIYAVVAFAASRFRGQLSILQGILGVFLSSLLFYLLTNTAAWISEPAYARNFMGWVQSMTVGLPGYAPTWVFFRNSLLADVSFSLLLMICFNVEARVKAVPLMPWSRLAAP